MPFKQKGDWTVGDKEKNKVEEAQRKMLRELQAAGKTNEAQFFVLKDNQWRIKSDMESRLV